MIDKPHLLILKLNFHHGTNIQITCYGQCHLGDAIGTQSFTDKYISKRVKLWLEIFVLSNIAQTQPHSAYCTFVHDVIPKGNYVMHTIESVGPLFQPLKDAMHQH